MPNPCCERGKGDWECALRTPNPPHLRLRGAQYDQVARFSTPSMIPAREASITPVVLVLTSSAVGNLFGTIVNSY